MHCQQTAEEEEEEGCFFFFLLPHSSRILIGRCVHLLEPHWPPALSLLDLLSPLPAPFDVHAQDKQARNRLETVWSLSEIDKIGDGVFYISLHIYERAAWWKWDFFVCSFLPPPQRRLRPRVATLSQKNIYFIYFFLTINAVKVFSPAVCQQTSSLCTGR